jgi:hypothetical protein
MTKPHGSNPRAVRAARSRQQVLQRAERQAERRSPHGAIPAHEFEPMRGPDDAVCARCLDVHETEP